MNEDYIPGQHVLHLSPTWSEFINVDPRNEPLCVVRPHDENGETVLSGCLRATIAGQSVNVSFPVKPVQREEFEKNLDGSMHRFGMMKIGPGTWKVIPSLNVPRVLHAFVVLCNVPEPAPWEATR
jgi:hypothetical protein